MTIDSGGHGNGTGVLLPRGGVVLARGLRNTGAPVPAPDFGLYLLGHPLDKPSLYGRLLVGLTRWVPEWPYEHVDWPDFAAPRHPLRAIEQLRGTLDRIERSERVEVACAGGRGRTGTALAAMAILQGSTAQEALAWVRSTYHPKAIESRRQRNFLQVVAANRNDAA
ncbi:protein phosphatase [Dactylosporangium aurantiacum]|uniref:Protein phosphatase n=1 Tax=Dactylosporangium aurantiacum TaxID=35754 RepID=A0A9Q9MMU5_9ACTN|nr:protein-tyrosine phosphatase family protein [Dactylosporangium aurantiacum]MDG6108267.1 protein-tyrosine phosphatase family protein [Dactylosporangium aurantiacum]UWZ58541.1 protein phosphatase [Dactylosporangium aurantiacum]